MERQSRLLMILSLVLLALVAVVLLDRPKEGEETGPPDHNAPPTHDLFDYKTDEITRVELGSPKGDVTFEKKDGKWAMVAPKTVPIDTGKVASIVERLSTAKLEERPLEGELSTYGLDAGARTRVVLGKADGKSYTLFVGKDAPVGYRTYIAEKEDGPARTVNTRIGDLFPGGADDFRSKQLWDVSASSAKRIKLEQGATTVVLRKDDHGWWIGDTGPRADDNVVEGWLSKAVVAKVDAFLDGQDPASLGLTTPVAKLSVEDANGTHELSFGPKGIDGAPAMTPSGPVRVGVDVMLLMSMSGWEGAKLMPVRTWQVDAVDLQLGDKLARFTKADDKWKDAAGAETGKPPELMGTLAELTADRTDLTLPAIGAAWGHLTLSEGTTRKESVILGELRGDSRLARDEAGGPTFLVKQADLDRLAASF